MKLRNTLIALACAAAGAAHAVAPADIVTARNNGTLLEVRVTGASALRLLVGAYLQADIADASTFDVFFDSAAGSNHRAYSFVTKTAISGTGLTTIPVGTTVLLTKRDAGGSAQGVTPLVNADATQTHMLVDNSCTTTANARPATDITKPTYLCTGTVAALAHGGLSDVEPALLQAAVNGGTGLDTTVLDAAGFVQNIFGVAVNKKAYLALQKAQGLVDVSATTIDESPAKQPSIPKAFVQGALTGGLLGSGSGKNGWNLLIPTSVDANVLTKRINVCRRNVGSGTQAASNMYFAYAGCSTVNSQAVTAGNATLPSSATGTITTTQNASSGAVEGCLGTTVEGLAGDAYGFGVLGRENNPVPVDAQGNPIQDKGYRFVKLSGVAPTRANAISGDYEFVTESSMQWAKPSQTNAPTGQVLTLLSNMRTFMGKAAILKGLDVDLREGLVAQPTTFTGPWVDLAADDRAYTSHSARKAANSCSFNRMSK